MATSASVTPELRHLVTSRHELEQAVQLLERLRGTPTVLQVGAGSAIHQVPCELGEVLIQVLDAVAHGARITIGSLPKELSTTVAAEQLGVSRPTLMKMIATGEIAARKVGSHHRLKTSDVLSARLRRLEQQRRSLDGLRELEATLDEL